MLFKNEEVVGLDIGTSSVKSVVIKKKLGKKEVKSNLTSLPLKASPSQISEILKEVFDKLKVSKDAKVKISISGSEVIFKYIYLPAMRRIDILNTIKLEWDKYVSFKMEDVCWDIQILEILKDTFKKRKEIFVLLVIAKKEIVDKKIQLLKDIGLYPQNINVDTLCLANAFKFFYPLEVKNKTIALLNIGNMYSNLIILKNGIPCFSRDIPLGSRDITQRISERKRISFDEAELLKKNFDGSDEEILFIIKRFAGNISNELALSFEYLKREIGVEVKNVYLSGGGAHLYQIKEFLTKNLNMKIDFWSFPKQFSKFSSPSEIQNLKDHFLDLVISLGMLVKDF